MNDDDQPTEVADLLKRARDPEREKRLALGHATSTVIRRGRDAPQTRTAMRYAARCGASPEEISDATGIPGPAVRRLVGRS